MTKGLRWDWERSFRAAPLESGPKLVGFVMATYGDANGADVYPSTGRLADACGMNVKTVRKHRDGLEAAGWIKPSRNNKGGRGRANAYRLTVPETLPTVGRVKRATTPPNPTKQREGIDAETLPNDAAKPSQATPLNPPNGWEGTSTDQTMDHKDVSAGPRADLASVPGLTHIEPDPNRRSADAREGDELALEAIQ